MTRPTPSTAPHRPPRRTAAMPAAERPDVVEAGRDRDRVLLVDRDPAAVAVTRHPGEAAGEAAHTEVAGGRRDQGRAVLVDQLPGLELGPAHPGGAVAERLDVGVVRADPRVALGVGEAPQAGRLVHRGRRRLLDLQDLFAAARVRTPAVLATCRNTASSASLGGGHQLRVFFLAQFQRLLEVVARLDVAALVVGGLAGVLVHGAAQPVREFASSWPRRTAGRPRRTRRATAARARAGPARSRSGAVHRSPRRARAPSFASASALCRSPRMRETTARRLSRRAREALSVFVVDLRGQHVADLAHPVRVFAHLAQRLRVEDPLERAEDLLRVGAGGRRRLGRGSGDRRAGRRHGRHGFGASGTGDRNPGDRRGRHWGS